MNLLQQSLFKLAKTYIRYSPIDFGKGALQYRTVRALNIKSVRALSEQGSHFELEFPEDLGWEDLAFRGVFETGTSRLMAKVLRKTDCVLDIGANLGWYTLIMASAVSDGQCHAFEPHPKLFQRLERHLELNGSPKNVRANQLALGDQNGAVDLYSFTELGLGHSSISHLNRSDAAKLSVPIRTLDSYLHETDIKSVHLVKIDVEGAEMSVLRGAGSLWTGGAPMWVVEMNSQTARCLGYEPVDLLKFLAGKADYTFYRIVHGWGEARPMRSITDFEHGDNVFGVPEQFRDRIDSLLPRSNLGLHERNHRRRQELGQIAAERRNLSKKRAA
jgi:FkbM family methyltransferase